MNQLTTNQKQVNRAIDLVNEAISTGMSTLDALDYVLNELSPSKTLTDLEKAEVRGEFL